MTFMAAQDALLDRARDASIAGIVRPTTGT
jgi:hypothetical protein